MITLTLDYLCLFVDLVCKLPNAHLAELVLSCRVVHALV